MSLTTSGGASILTPDQVDQLVVRPFSQESVALRTSTVVPINSHTLRIPIVTADPVAGFVAEGAEISATDPTLTEVNITPYKLAGLVVIRPTRRRSSPATVLRCARCCVSAGSSRTRPRSQRSPSRRNIETSSRRGDLFSHGSPRRELPYEATGYARVERTTRPRQTSSSVALNVGGGTCFDASADPE